MLEKLHKNNEHTVESANNDSIDILVKMRDKYDPDKAKQLIELEKTASTINSSSRPKIEKETHSISEENETSENSNSIAAQRTLDVIPQSKVKTQRKLTLSDKYDIKERPRVDRIKSDLNLYHWKFFEYERKQSTSGPSIFKKALRLITDKIGIRTKRSEELRDREAMRVALIEHRKEEEAEQRAFEERQKKDALEREKREAEYKAYHQAEKARTEREFLEDRMSEARDYFDFRKQEGFKKQRVQEIVETDLNARLLTTDNLEAEILSNNPEIQKQSVLFNGTKIPVYNLKGLPFSILSTTIDYRSANDKAHGGIFDIGSETYKKVIANPAIWGERREDAEKSDGFGTRNSNARGDTISASYWNSERNINSHFPGDLIYGFERVEPDSIISVHNCDGGTDNMAGRDETDLMNPDEIKYLEGADGRYSYNEILLRRYSENGIPKKPDYIITENGKITEAALRHARYFGIPIVNIDRAIYAAKMKKRGEEIINSINADDSYLDLDNKITELLSMSKYKIVFPRLERIGRSFDIPRIPPNASDLEKRCFEIAKIEQLKRIDFIKTTLEDAIDKIKMHRDKMVSFQIFSQFAYFHIYIQDVHNQIRITPYGNTEDSFYNAPGNCNRIDVSFRIKGSSRNVETNIYDGERILKFDKALANGVRTEEDLKNSDSSFYDAIDPLARKFCDEFCKNRDLIIE